MEVYHLKIVALFSSMWRPYVRPMGVFFCSRRCFWVFPANVNEFTAQTRLGLPLLLPAVPAKSWAFICVSFGSSELL